MRARMRAPTFGYPGGKARIRDKIISVFPRAGRIYLEPFGGRGNLFFAARAIGLTFAEWRINDLNTAPFFHAIRELNIDELPGDVADRGDFDSLKSNQESMVSQVLAPFVTYCGKGYAAGFATPTVNRKYCRKAVTRRILAARKLLDHVKISGISWDKIDWADLDRRDFVYLDPPYLDACEGTGYKDIDHAALLDMLSRARFRWVLSGFDSRLYRDAIGTPVTFMRVSSMAARMKSKNSTRVECLWSNTWRAAQRCQNI